MKTKQTLLLLFCVLSGIVLGCMLGDLCAGIAPLRWLGYAKAIRLTPALDLNVLRLNIDFTMSLSPAQVLTIGLGLYVYSRIKKL